MTKADLRALVAEAVATSFLFASDPAARIAGLSFDDVRQRALAKIQVDDNFKLALTMACDQIVMQAERYSDDRIADLLQDGNRTLNVNGGVIEVEVAEPKLRATSILDGAGLDVSDGAFVIFIDSRSASPAALKKWQQTTNDDTSVMMIPLDPPTGQTVRDVVAAKRQTEGNFAR